MPQLAKTAPAFQLYASDTMADKRYRSMSLEERGLYLSILCECWVNRSMPADPQSIGKWLGYSQEVIETALTEDVLSFFEMKKSEITSAELERYRKLLEERREKQSRGGKKGAKVKWDKSLDGDNHPINPPYGVEMGSRVELKGEEKNRREYKEDIDIDDIDPWITAYDQVAEERPIPF